MLWCYKNYCAYFLLGVFVVHAIHISTLRICYAPCYFTKTISVRFFFCICEVFFYKVNAYICFKVIHADGIEEEPLKILNLAKELHSAKIFINKDYGFNERRRDSELEKLADHEGISLNLFDSSIIDPRNIKTGTGNFFKVFTPYSKVFRNLLTAEDLSIEPEPKTQEISHFQNDEIPEYVLEDENLRQGIKDFSDWPTIPQLYVKGEFVGGCDIVKEMFEKGELKELFKSKSLI